MTRLLVVSALVAVWACQDPVPGRATLSVTDLLAGDDTVGFARADRPRDFIFPDDHGPHPEFRHEWWYYTGNVRAADGRRFGFQLTFFRSALRPDTAEVASPWATNQAYMAHFALTDSAGGRFHAFERFDRGALGLAGATAEPFRVAVGDWSAAAVPSAAASDSMQDGRVPRTRLRAAEAGVGIDLVLEPLKPPVFQGDDGLSRKGPEPGNASYYYSLTRLGAAGTVTLDGAGVAVRGEAWLDREWGTSALGPELEGWDWFSIQLDDRTELVYFQLRREDDRIDPHNHGSFVHQDGRVTPLGPDDVAIEATAEWSSPRGGRYPAGWTLRVPGLGLELGVRPVLPDQELDLAFRYWEGAVTVEGVRATGAVRGHGYVELTGYAAGVRTPAARAASSVATSSSTGRPTNRSTR